MTANCRLRASRPSSISTIALVFTCIQILTISGVQQAASSTQSTQKNVTNPLIYKRLRFDEHSLQVYRRYQKYLAMDEQQVRLRFNETYLDDNSKSRTREVEFEYYENPQVEATSITYDDLVFDALDRTYHTRLWPAFIYNYDKEGDVERASDKSKVSRSRCAKELAFLMSQLSELERVRAEPSAKGARISNTFNPELLAFLDAFGHEEPGLLLGHYHWTGGQWRECNRRNIFNVDAKNLSNSVDFTGRYCLASLRSPTWDAKAAARADEWDKIDQFRYPDQKMNYQRYFRVQVGMCLPESCDSLSIQAHREDIQRLATHKIAHPIKSYDLVDLYCLPDESSELRQIEPRGKLFIAWAVLWLALVFTCTWLDYKQRRAADSKLKGGASGAKVPTDRRPPTALERLVSAMSLIRNFERFIETKSCQPTPPLSERLATLAQNGGARQKLIASSSGTPAQLTPTLAPNDLLFMNFFKVICIPIILLGHSGLELKQLDRFALDFDCLISWVAHFHFSAALFVDWFFVITGFLTTYIMFVTNRVALNKPVEWLYMIFHRYWRLAPLYILTFWFAQSVFMYTSSGPLWDYGTSNMTLRSICRRESIWVPITLTSNFHGIHEECIMPTWYVSADFQFSLLVPFLLVLLHRSPLAGWLVTLGAIGASNSLRFYRYLTDPHVKPIDLLRPRYDLYMRNNWDMHETYLFPQYRISPFLVGILAGHYTFMVLSGRWRSSLYAGPALGTGARSKGWTPSASEERSSARRRLIVWLTSVTTLTQLAWATLLLSLLFPIQLEPNARFIAALVYSNSHTIAGVALALFLVTMMLGQFEWLKQAMAAPVITVFSRLNYVVFIIQLEAIYWFMQSQERQEEQTTFVLMKYFFTMVSVVYPLAFALVLVLELPLSQLERNFVAPLLQARKSEARDETSAVKRQTAGELEPVGQAAK